MKALAVVAVLMVVLGLAGLVFWVLGSSNEFYCPFMSSCVPVGGGVSPVLAQIGSALVIVGSLIFLWVRRRASSGR
jgi:hypothetical protein